MNTIIFSHMEAADAARYAVLDPVWNRYVRAYCAEPEGESPICVEGREYEMLLNLRHSDPRAAEMLLDLRLRVLPDGSEVCGDTSPLSGRGREISDAFIAGVRHEISCMRFLGRLPGYNSSVFDHADEDWSLYTFAREKYLREPDGVHFLRAAKICVPDYSNVTELPGPKALEQAV